eukprot:2379740-Pyramimonas_sp.AAC.1
MAFVKDHIEAGTQRFLGAEGEKRLKDAMPAKLRRWEEKSGKIAEDAAAAKKRAAAAAGWETQLQATADGEP